VPDAACTAIVDEVQASNELAAAYEQCGDPGNGHAAHIMKVHSLNPQSMLDHRAIYSTLMFGPSPLGRYQREMIGVVVSALNKRHY